MKVDVISLVGDFCVIPDDGYTVCDAVLEGLTTGDEVEICFSGVVQLTSSFLNAAVGSLYQSLPHDLVDEKLKCTGLAKVDEDLLKLVRQNAKRFYSADVATRKKLVSSIESH